MIGLIHFAFLPAIFGILIFLFIIKVTETIFVALYYMAESVWDLLVDWSHGNGFSLYKQHKTGFELFGPIADKSTHKKNISRRDYHA